MCVVQIEDFGRPLAWKLDSCFAVLLETDLRGLAALVTRSFMQNNLVVNDWLPLVRIECELNPFLPRCHRTVPIMFLSYPGTAVNVTGTPQPFEAIRQHSRPELCARRADRLSAAQWQRHVGHMRDLNILSSQACEFQTSGMRTEGKTAGRLTGKPDLIPLAGITPLPVTPSRRLSNDSAPIPVELSQMRRPSARISPRTSPLHLIPEGSEENGSLKAAVAPEPQTKGHLEQLAAATAQKIALVSPMQVVDKPPMASPEKCELVETPAGTPERLVATVEPSPVVESVEAVDAVEAVAEPPPAPPAATSVRSSGAARPTLVRSKGSLIASKPPNVLVYSESTATRDAVIQTLADLLAADQYTVYPLSAADVRTQVWLDNTTMLVVCGSVAADIGVLLTEFFLRGGKMLSLCSDVLHIVLPTFRTHAEVREHELVQFSYGRWQRVRMMHHIFCYQPSPVRKHFSTDSDESPASGASGGLCGAPTRKP